MEEVVGVGAVDVDVSSVVLVVTEDEFVDIVAGIVVLVVELTTLLAE